MLFDEDKKKRYACSIPEWLNEAAERADINFSGVLQDALMKQLNLN